MALLLEAGADPSTRNVRDETPLDLAAQYGRFDTVQLLMSKHPYLLDPYKKEVPEEGEEELFPRKSTRVFMHTPLHSASRNGHL